MIIHPVDLIREFKETPVYSAALFHRSARRPETLERLGVDTDMLDAWDTLGIEIILLFASRLSLNNPSCRSAGTASLATRALGQSILARLGTKFALLQLGIFGDGVTVDERAKSSSYANIIRQLVGAVAYREGYSAAVKKCLLPFFEEEGFSVDVGKEEKTSLQEILQKKRLRPSYETIAVYGKHTSQIFRVRVMAEGKSADGEGPSRKLAEQKAAAAYLSLYFPDVTCASTLHFQPELTVSSIIKSIPRLENFDAVSQLIRSYKIQSEFALLFSLAFTHASYSYKYAPSLIGKDNKVLAFLGSQVLNWAAKDAAAHSMTNRDIKNAGGLGALIPVLLGEDAYLGLFDSLTECGVLLLGGGEKEIIKSSRIEFVQAFCGALFLSRSAGTILNANGFFESVGSFEEFFSSEIETFKLTRDKVLPPKTLLQERCQAANIRVAYQSRFESYGGRLTVLPRIRFESPWVEFPLQVDGVVEITEANKSRRKAEVESNLAETVIPVLDYVRGYAQERFDASQDYVARWMFDHFSSALESLISHEQRAGRAKLAVEQSFALSFLRENDFWNFSSWWATFSEWVEKRGIDLESFASFYGRVGHGKNADKRQKKLSYNLQRLEAFLNELDPLNDTIDVKMTQQYKALLHDAITHKLLGSEAKEITIKNFLSDASLLFKSSVYVSESAANSELELLEVDGALLAFLSFLIALINDGHLAGPVLVSVYEQNLVFCANKKPGEGLLSELLKEFPLWDVLSLLLPIVEFEENDAKIVVAVPTIDNSLSKRVLSYWCAYQLNGAVGKAANDVIASMLHDLKNNVLGYCSASQNARSANVRERYHLAAQANDHLSRSTATIRALSSFLESTATAFPSALNMEEFLRKQISRAWSWLPSDVKLVAPTGFYPGLIWTHHGSLQSIVENLLKNAVEAMSGKGVVHFECELLDGNSAVVFSVQDEGSGFSHEQLEWLNNGIPVASTKSQGHGIGLLTVLLLVKDLGGQASFSNIGESGAVVQVWIPSDAPKLEISEPNATSNDNLIFDN
jgi:dsRNA-specific ribonuclease